MAKLDLSAAFNVVNIQLLLKIFKILGLLEDIITLIKIWLDNRMFYVDVKGESSYIKIRNQVQFKDQG